MSALAKIIKRLFFGPSLEDCEARQKAENEKYVKAMLTDADRRDQKAWDIIHKQAAYFQKRIPEYSTPPKGNIIWVPSGNSNITATVSNGR